MSTLTINVHGTPAPQGSKRHVGNGVMIESSAKVKPWRQDVKHAALEARNVGTPHPPNYDPLTGPLSVVVTFYLRRPKSHYRTGRNANLLRGDAPVWPHRKPDIDKLLRSTLDALGEAGVWIDDAQVVEVGTRKRYADHRAPGALIEVRAA